MGASVTAAAVAVAAGREHGEALLVDLRGDQASILGLAAKARGGIFDWLASRVNRRESLEQLTIPTNVGVRLLQPGSIGEWDPARAQQVVDLLASYDHPVVVDCGVRPMKSPSGSSPSCEPIDDLVDRLCGSSRSVLVSSSCYLAVRRAVKVITTDASEASTRRPGTDGLIVVSEPGRALTASDVASVTQLELLAAVERDPGVARCVDAGQFLTRPPRSLLSAVRAVL